MSQASECRKSSFVKAKAIFSTFSAAFGSCFGALPNEATRTRTVPCLRQRSRRIPIDQTPERQSSPRGTKPGNPSFRVASVRRVRKIDDYEYEVQFKHAPPWIPPILVQGPASYDELSPVSTPTSELTTGASSTENGKRPRTTYRQATSPYSNLPFGAKVHKTSWVSKDYEQWRKYEAERESFELEATPEFERELASEPNSKPSAGMHETRQLPWDGRVGGKGASEPPPHSWYQQDIPQPGIVPRSSFRRPRRMRQEAVISDPFETPASSQRADGPPAAPEMNSSEQYREYGRACLWPRKDIRYASSSATINEADGNLQPRTDVYCDAQEEKDV